MLGGPRTRSSFPPPSGSVTPPRCGLFLLRRSHALGEDREELLSGPLILLDTAHDGIFEQRVYNALGEDGYQGLLLLDDIYLNPIMQRFWSEISVEKLDATAVGHWSGTGLVQFGTFGLAA